jgi:hypothetical protein
MNNYFARFVVCCAISCSLVLLASCAGRTPDPVAEYQSYDTQMTCTDINAEIQRNQQRIAQLLPKTQKTGKNVALAATGAVFLVPLFFMDFSDAEQREINAFERRDVRLHMLAESHKCHGIRPKIKIEMKQRVAAAAA